MNLHSIANPVITAVNNNMTVRLMQGTGYAVNDDFSRTPIYASINMAAQIQGLQSNDIRVLNGLGIQGVRRKVYLWGAWSGLIRSLQKGSDLMVFPDGSEWKIAYVFENYGHGVQGSTGWCSVAVVLQNPLSQDAVMPPTPPPPLPSFVELGTMTTYTLVDGAYKDQRIRIIDNLFLGGQVITGNFNTGPTITFIQPGQWIDPFWDGAQWVVGSFGGVL